MRSARLWVRSSVSMNKCEASVGHAMQRTWNKFFACKELWESRAGCWKQRVLTVQRVCLATQSWDCEAWTVSMTDLRVIRGMQRSMMENAMKVRRFPEDGEMFGRRRSRKVSQMRGRTGERWGCVIMGRIHVWPGQVLAGLLVCGRRRC